MEIIVVLVILAILAAIAVPTTFGYVDDAKEVRELAKLRESLIAAQVTFVKSAELVKITIIVSVAALLVKLGRMSPMKQVVRITTLLIIKVKVFKNT